MTSPSMTSLGPVPIFDGHNDVLLRLYRRGGADAPQAFLAGESKGQLDLPKAHQGRFAGGLFALTRWTNIYFPLEQVFWGDAIGGPLGPVFGDHIEDREVWTDSSRPNGVFTHTKYWDTKFKEGRAAPHIVALREAVDVADQQA